MGERDTFDECVYKLVVVDGKNQLYRPVSHYFSFFVILFMVFTLDGLSEAPIVVLLFVELAVTRVGSERCMLIWLSTLSRTRAPKRRRASILCG